MHAPVLLASPPTALCCIPHRLSSELLSELHRREAEMNITVEPELEAFMKAKVGCSLQGVIARFLEECEGQQGV